jgi:hypothetical protein
VAAELYKPHYPRKIDRKRIVKNSKISEEKNTQKEPVVGIFENVIKDILFY